MASTATSMDLGRSCPQGQQQYIFNEMEFEGDDFHAAAFVGKYRRVTTLESLRDQLRAYGSGLKDQLYETINRDYKDFIDIATKLDGVDSRVQHLKKPLIDLRIEALSLHDGIVTSLEAIQQKLRKKSELRQRALLLETTLSCMSKFDDVDRLLCAQDLPTRRARLDDQLDLPDKPADGVLSDSGAPISRRSDLVRYTAMREARRIVHETTFKKGEDKTKHQLSYQQTQYTKMLHLLRTQLLKASELERAGYALASAKGSINLLSQRLEQHVSSSVTSAGRVRSNSVGNKSVTELSDRASRLEASVISRVHELLSQALVSGPSVQAASIEAGDHDGGGAGSSLRMLRARVIGHILRTLNVLGRCHVAQSILSENIVYPLARSVLSQGRVNGTGGRGFYAGLEEALVHIVATLATAPGVSELIALAEDIFSRPDTGTVPEDSDFLVNGIWKPVATVLVERFQGMFSVGVAVAMHRAFSALEHFTAEIPRVLLVGSDDKSEASYLMIAAAISRMSRHPEIVGFRNKWKLDLYFQLRRQEITTRLEHAISLLCPAGADNLRSIAARSDATSIMSIVYFSEQQPLQQAAHGTKPGQPVPGAATTTTVAARSVIPRTISTDIAKTAVDTVVGSINKVLGNSSLTFKLPLVEAIVIEVYSCLHSTVFLPPLAGPFLALIVQLFMRLEAQVCAAVPQISPPSFASHDIILKALQLGSNANATPSSSSGDNTVYTTTDDLVDLLGDLMLLRAWMRSGLPKLILSKLNGDGVLSSNTESSLQSAIEKSLHVQCLKTLTLMNGVWARISSMLCTDCKSSLQAVKGVAGKYRLTNKPPPEAASPFVTTILNPLREFVSKYTERVGMIRGSMAVRDFEGEVSWQVEIVEDITAAYLQQVQSLVETARQMDSVFMKRSKAAAPKAGATSLSDSEKIALQMIFDINEFQREIESVGISDPFRVASFAALHAQISEMKKIFLNLNNF